MSTIQGWQSGDLVADQAHAARTDYGRCGLCPHELRRGEHIARLVSGSWVHTACAAAMPHEQEG